jgi:uncharacterized protein (DUF1800 family)
MAEVGMQRRRIAAAAAIPVNQRLVQRITMGATPGELARVNAIGYDAYLEEQLDFESLDDRLLERRVARDYPATSLTTAELLLQYKKAPFTVAHDHLQIATMLRSISSPRQLFERMVIFWSDHFNIDTDGDAIFLKPSDDRDVIRRHAMGTFPELLRASAYSPAMLYYLDNYSNTKEFPQENYAREILELHTLGVDKGYTQNDIVEVARCLTGWTFFDLSRRPKNRRGDFMFEGNYHDYDAKVVLGSRIPAGGGISDGETVLEMLAEHPNTAEFIARKLLRYFWGYEPKGSMVRKVKRAYLQTGGDIRAMLRVVLSRKLMRTATPKLKRPYHLIVSTVRAMEADVDPGKWLMWVPGELRHGLFDWDTPDGYPDTFEYWSGSLLNRWNFAQGVIGNWNNGIDPDLSFLANPPASDAELVDQIDQQFLAGGMSPETRNVILDYMSANPHTGDWRVRQVMNLVISSPEFQWY